VKKIVGLLLVFVLSINIFPVYALTYTKYEIGDKINVQVNDSTTLEFYVIEDSDSSNDSVKAIYVDTLENKYNFTNAKNSINSLKNNWTNVDSVSLPKIEDIFKDKDVFEEGFKYTENLALSNLRYWTSDSYGVDNEKTLGKFILSDNDVISGTNIDFSTASTAGLYYTNKNTEGNEYTYYFRGDIDNNYVKFGKDKDENDLYWRIVRINEDGSVRLIYQGTSATATGDDATIGTSTFNTGSIVGQYNAYVGYMYGLIGIFSITSPVCVTYDGANDKAVNSTATYGAKPECEKAKGVWATTEYEATHANVVDSEVKKMLDKWYENNLLNYSSYIADAGFCNDRSVASTAYTWASNDTALGDSRNTTYYGAYNRLYTNKTPQFACPNADNDLFTTSTSTKGNKALTYPIGLIIADEVAYAGGKAYGNSSYYLNTDSSYWTMSPRNFYDTYAYGWSVIYRGSLGRLDVEHSANYLLGIRPVINLKADVIATLNGTGKAGTSTNPYIIGWLLFTKV